MGITFDDIDHLVKLSKHPLENCLEELQGFFLGEYQRENYYRFLYHLVKFSIPYVVLEIGVSQGIGSIYMIEAAKKFGGHVVGVDINPVWIHRDNYTFIHGDSTKTKAVEKVREIVYHHGKIGVVYQDSSHHYEASCKEWELYSQFLDDDAVWVCDDITPAFKLPEEDKGMVEYFNERPGQKKLYKDVLHHGNTQGVILL